MNDRVFNFSAGPAVLPEPVLEQIREEMLCLPGAGASILEISHRGEAFQNILETTTHDLQQLLDIPDNYRLLYLQGGSRLQFSMIPMNLLRRTQNPADYLLTGSWGKKAYEEAIKEGLVNIAWDGSGTNYDRLPVPGEVRLSSTAAYAYFTSNETIQGVQFPEPPEVPDEVPLICDASSDFLCRPLNINDYGLIYACAQKNAGPAGVTLVIIREDLLEHSYERLPGYLSYANHADNNSLYNTPPTFAVYVVGLVAKWLRNEMGGLTGVLQHNQEKAALLYDAIDGSDGFYTGHADPGSRSLMNVTFRLANDDLQEPFLKAATGLNLYNLKGHRSVGGIRASIYNAMPIEGIRTLAEFMRAFAAQHG